MLAAPGPVPPEPRVAPSVGVALPGVVVAFSVEVTVNTLPSISTGWVWGGRWAASIATWVAGLVLVMTPGVVDWSMVWPWTKAAGVIAMTVFHHWLMIQRRRLARGEGLSGRRYRMMNEVPTLLMVIIVLSVIVKF